MPTVKDIQKKREEAIRKEWFKEHVASHRLHATLEGKQEEHLIWAKPGTGVYRVDYRRFGGVLVVTGDIGEAVYQWYGPNGGTTLEWIAGLELGYFAEKCVASEFGKGYPEWSEELARSQMEEILHEPGMEGAEHQWVDLSGDDCLGSKDEWMRFMYDNGQKVFEENWTEYGWIGNIVNMRCQGHLLGLRMALLEKK